MFRFQAKTFNTLHPKILQKGESELGNLGFGGFFFQCVAFRADVTEIFFLYSLMNDEF